MLTPSLGTDIWIKDSSRQSRYATLYALMHSTLFEDIRAAGAAMKVQYKLFEYTLDYYNPAARLANFYGTYLFNNMFQDISPDWQQYFNRVKFSNILRVLARNNSVLGDGFIAVFKDGMSYINPYDVTEVVLDTYGNVKSCKYKGTTYTNGFYLFPHIPTEYWFGYGEFNSLFTTLRGLFETASRMLDYTHRLMGAPIVFAGVNFGQKGQQQNIVVSSATTMRSFPFVQARDSSASGAAIKPGLELNQALEIIESILNSLEGMLPELSLHRGLERTSGDLSGSAVTALRQDVVDKIRAHRYNYIERWHEVFDFIGIPNPPTMDVSAAVFTPSQQQQDEHEKSFWINLALAQRTGADATIYLTRQGWTSQQIEEFTSTGEYKARLAAIELDSIASDTLKIPSTAELVGKGIEV